MSKIVNDGNFYVKNRKNMEKQMMKKDLDVNKENVGIEGFDVVSRSFQLNNPNKFTIPPNLDPGQTVMCEKNNRARYIKIVKFSNKIMEPLSIERIEVYDENGQNVSMTNNNNYINEYEITKGRCKITEPVLLGGQTLTGNYRGQITSNNCETLCNNDNNCSGFTIKNEENSEGLNQCWTYEQPNIIGDNDKNYICRVKQRKEGTSKASSNGLFFRDTHAYKPLTNKSQGSIPFFSQITTKSQELENNSINIDGGFPYREGGYSKNKDYGRYTRGWALSNGFNGSNEECKKLCNEQPECMNGGCESTLYEQDKRCYCKFTPSITKPALASNHEWEVDLGKEVNIKRIVIYINQIVVQMLTNQTADVKLYVLDKNQNTLITKSLQNVTSQTIDINIQSSKCGGPVIEKNIADFDELKDLQTAYNRQLQEYNQAVKDLIENSRGYVAASNSNNNRFANTYLKDQSSGAIGFVTDKGTWKHLPNPQMGNSMQGKNGCPANWESAQSIAADDGKSSIFNASEGEIIKMGGASIVKGTPTLANQSCRGAGQNMYVTNPSKTSNRQYIECSQGQGSYQSDLGSTTLEACAMRAADMGSNVFQMGPNNGGGTGNCYINGGGWPLSNQSCPNVPGVGNMGVSIPGYWQWNQSNNWWAWWGGYWSWVPGTYGFATYQTTGANNNNLGKTFYITDDLTKKEYPSYMVSRNGDDFQLLSGYNSYGNDIVSGSGLSLEQVKQKCIETPGAAGFYMNGNRYWIKNANMWPNGNRQYTGGDLYIRNTTVNNSNSCSKQVNFSQETEIDGYVNTGFMDMSTTCGLGSISKRDTQFIREQYNKLNALLDKMYQKIVEVSGEDSNLNERLLSEYKLLKNKLNTYENTYKEIRTKKDMMFQASAMEEDSNLQMLSYNEKYILWSMLALGVTAGAMKLMKQ